MKARSVIARWLCLAVVSLAALGCAANRAATTNAPLLAIASDLDRAHLTLSALRARHAEESPAIRAQWEIIAGLERRWIAEVGKAARALFVVVGGPPWTMQFRYTLADDRLLVETSRPNERKSSDGRTYHETRIKCIELGTREATELWRKVDALGIDRWRERYEPKDLGVEIADGTSWGVSLRIEGREKRASGFNVYPAKTPLGAPVLEVVERGTLVKSAYHELRELLVEAAKGS